METKEVGEYLKRLRRRAGYTQADTGYFVNVTDKAISRWESGSGFPEISNLTMLAKLYGVTVDDILNCNEKVFGNAEKTEPAADAAAESVEKDESEATATAVPAAEEKRRKTSEFFDSVLFFAYLTVWASILPFTVGGTLDSVFMAVFNILAAVLGLTATVINMIGAKMPSKAQKTVNIITDSVFLALPPLMIGIVNIYYGSDIGTAVTLGYALCELLGLMRLFYTVADFASKEKTAKILKIINIGLAVAVLSVCIAIMCLRGFVFDAERYNSLSLTSLAVALATFFFALAETVNKKLYYAVVGIWVLFIIVLAVLLVSTIQVPDIYHDLYFTTTPPAETWLCIATLTPICLLSGKFFEDKSYNKIADIVLYSIAFVSVIPLFIFTCDEISADFILSYDKEYSLLLYPRLAVLAAVSACCAVKAVFAVMNAVRRESK